MYDTFSSLSSPFVSKEPQFTGKERDAESGLDYFGARYYASSMGRWMSPDWSAKEEPVPYAKLDSPQSLNLYSYVGNNPLSRVDPEGHEIVQLGQHTDKEINARTKEINGQLKDKSLSADAKSALKAEKTTLGIEKQGNEVASAYLSRLDSVGQRNGLSLKDIAVTTDPANDFAGKNVDMAKITNPGTQAFVINHTGSMYLKTNTFTYMNAFDPTSGLMMRDLGGSILRHEQVHQGGGDEPAAYGVQRQVFGNFKSDFTPEAFKGYYDQMHP
jgi:RHS repeat-associated protein